MSHNDPRPTDAHSSKRSAGDGVYDIALADKLVMRAASGCSFRAGAASNSDTAIVGISRDTPGAIYDPDNGGRSAIVPATRFSSADRFPVGTTTFDSPGPGHYNAVGSAGRFGAVSWTGVETFMDSEWGSSWDNKRKGSGGVASRARVRGAAAEPCALTAEWGGAPPGTLPAAAPWEGFGNGCNLQEHIDYGACLDGRCCTRHSVERKNALRVVQFLGQQEKGVGRGREQGQGQRRSRRAVRPNRRVGGRSNGNNTDRCTVGAESGRHQGFRPTGASSPLSPLSPLSITPSEGRDSKREGFSSTPVGESVGGKAQTPGAEDGSLRANGSAGSLSAAFNSMSSPCLEESGASCSSADTGAQGPSTASTDASGRGGTVASCSDEARVADGKRTPLHFASERGELALVDRTPHRYREGGTKVGPEVPQSGPVKCPLIPTYRTATEVAGAQRIYQLLQYKADVSLVKANIAALEEREHMAARLRREAEQAGALKELAELKKEELRLRAALDVLEAKRSAYAKATKVQ
eukprot:g7866.t1